MLAHSPWQRSEFNPFVTTYHFMHARISFPGCAMVSGVCVQAWQCHMDGNMYMHANRCTMQHFRHRHLLILSKSAVTVSLKPSVSTAAGSWPADAAHRSKRD